MKIKNDFSYFVLPNLQSATSWDYQSLWSSDALSQNSSFPIFGYSLLQVLNLTSPRGWMHSVLCCACSKRTDHTICGVLAMASVSLTPKTKVLFDFGKYVFYLDWEQRAHLFLHFVLYPPSIQSLIFNTPFSEEKIMGKTDAVSI